MGTQFNTPKTNKQKQTKKNTKAKQKTKQNKNKTKNKQIKEVSIDLIRQRKLRTTSDHVIISNIPEV